MRRYRWYLSAAAVREYLRIAGLPDDDGGPGWARAEREMGAHADAARLHSEDGVQQKWRTARVQVGDRPRKPRLELTVSTSPRPEGPLPQLVWVRTRSA